MITQENYRLFLQGECQHNVSGYQIVKYCNENNLFPLNKYFLRAFRRYIRVTHKEILVKNYVENPTLENEFKIKALKVRTK